MFENVASQQEIGVSVREYRSTSPKQAEFLDACFGLGDYPIHGEDEIMRFILGGGAGFGGKSYAIRTGVLEAALRLSAAGVRNPRQLVICKVLGDLEERHIAGIEDDVHAVTGQPNGLCNFGTIRMMRTGHYLFTFEGEYAALGTVVFKHGNDINRRRGAGYHVIWVDELTQFERDEFDSMRYMLRSAVGVPFLLFAGATNPDGIGNAWVKKLWVDRAFGDEPGLIPGSFHFVRFFAQDNPCYNRQVEINLASISNRFIRRARQLGEWDMLTSTRFAYSETVHSFSWQNMLDHYGVNCRPMELLTFPGMFSIIGSFDYGFGAESASVYYLHAVGPDGYVWTFGELYMEEIGLRDQAAMILEFEKGLNVEMRWCDPALKITGSDITGKSRINLFIENGVVFYESINERVAGWAVLDYGLDYRINDEGVLTRKPQWRIHENCPEAHQFLRNALADQHKPEDVAKKFKRDHSGDAMRYGLTMVITPPDVTKFENPLDIYERPKPEQSWIA